MICLCRWGFIRDIQVAESADGTLCFDITIAISTITSEVLQTDSGQLMQARASVGFLVVPLGLPRFDPSIGSRS